MTWKDLTPNNIEEIKQLYIDYLSNRHHEAMAFEDFLECVEQCPMCEKYELTAYMMDTEGKYNAGFGYVCEDCYGDI